MFDRTKFKVDLSIDKATRIPYADGHLFVRWSVTDSARPDARGRTSLHKIHQTESNFDYTTSFHQSIRIKNPSRHLKPCPTKFELMWSMDDSKAVNLGVLNLDLSEFASSTRRKAGEEEHEHFSDHSSEPYGRSLMYILSGARTNGLLQIRIKLDVISGADDFVVPEFTGRAVNYLNEGEDQDPNSSSGSSIANHSRDKLRKLREAVLQDIRADSDNNRDSEWYNLDNLILGKNIRVEPRVSQEELKRYHVLDVGSTPGLVVQHDARPYQETEIRESLATWRLSK